MMSFNFLFKVFKLEKSNVNKCDTVYNNNKYRYIFTWKLIRKVINNNASIRYYELFIFAIVIETCKCIWLKIN